MPEITQQDIHKHMQVYTKDQTDLGHVSEAYEDSFQVQKGLVGKHIYLPYTTIATLEEKRITLTLSTEETEQTRWRKRPDYENHLGDPVQLAYDRGHGVHDPFDETNPKKIG